MTREMTYRNCAIGGASPIGLMIALFDRLVADLGRAAVAIRKDDIETRCNELNHALLIVGQLESWVDKQRGGEPAEQLSIFYAFLRAKMIEASIRKSPETLEQQIQTILQIRSAWQQLDLQASAQADASSDYASESASGSSTFLADSNYERIPFSQSA